MKNIFLKKTLIGKDGSVMKIKHECALTSHKKEWNRDEKEQDMENDTQKDQKRILFDDIKWDVMDLDNKNTQIKGVTTCFIRSEIYKGRIIAEPGWDN